MVETTNSTACVRARKRNIVAGIPELISVRKASMRMPIVVDIGYTPRERGLKTVAVVSSLDMFITAQTRFAILSLSITRQDFHLILKIIRNDGAIFEQGTDEIQSAFRFAMFNHNKNTTIRKFELQAYVDVINTADAYKLSRLSE
ncbi:glutamate receptor 1 isoform X2 [Vespula squamosa]|uniref:Glutamate receptor 1 isoform X2 n=1 Tax=Vespula squamosa TaxID=30214 RepID=A0ABD2AGB3_VESSQ